MQFGEAKGYSGEESSGGVGESAEDTDQAGDADASDGGAAVSKRAGATGPERPDI